MRSAPILGAAVLVAIAASGLLVVHSLPAGKRPAAQSASVATDSPTATPTAAPTNSQIDEPKRLSIISPSVAISAAVEDVHQVGGYRGTPNNPNDVGWCSYRCSAPPGWDGDLLLVGHYDDVRGHPAVFYHLSQLLPGVEVRLTTASGKTLNYVVDTVREVPYVPGTDALNLAGPGSPPRMVLETCAGTWDGQTYNKRTVVVAHQSN
jgi:Sortase domain